MTLLLVPVLYVLPMVEIVYPTYSAAEALPPEITERLRHSLSWFLISLTIVCFAAVILVFWLWVPWICSVDAIKMRWYILSLALVYCPLITLHNQFVARYASRAIHAASEFFEALL
jgi:hypothetical protein